LTVTVDDDGEGEGVGEGVCVGTVDGDGDGVSVGIGETSKVGEGSGVAEGETAGEEAESPPPLSLQAGKIIPSIKKRTTPIKMYFRFLSIIAFSPSQIVGSIYSSWKSQPISYKHRHEGRILSLSLFLILNQPGKEPSIFPLAGSTQGVLQVF